MMTQKVYRLTNVLVSHAPQKPGEVVICRDWADILERFKDRPWEELIQYVNGDLGRYAPYLRTDARSTLNMLAVRVGYPVFWSWLDSSETWYGPFTPKEIEWVKRMFVAYCDRYELTEVT